MGRGGHATPSSGKLLPAGPLLPSPGRQVELRPHLCSHLERVWRGVAGAGLRPRGARRDGPARLSDLRLIETPCSRRSARSPDSCRAEPGRMENPGCAGPGGARGGGVVGGCLCGQVDKGSPSRPVHAAGGRQRQRPSPFPGGALWPGSHGPTATGGAPLILTHPPTPLPRRGPVWGLWESHPQLPAPTPPPRPGSETSCLPGSGQLGLWEAGGAGAVGSPPPTRPTGLWGPGGSVRGGGARPGPRAAIRWGRCGLRPPPWEGGRAGRPVASGARAGKEDAAGRPISGIPGAHVAQALRGARFPSPPTWESRPRCWGGPQGVTPGPQQHLLGLEKKKNP